jgi:hypothetical protein
MSRTEDGVQYLTLEEMDRKDDEVLKARFQEARRRGVLKVDSGDRAGKRKRTYRIHTGQLGYRSVMTPAGMVDVIQRRMQARIAAEEFARERPPVQHVKDGKPLTPTGAKILGVPWEGEGHV